jgi:gamma-glutamylcyclotransferase (GGCT)/AIG2-like uncharacterized protein YtfP
MRERVFVYGTLRGGDVRSNHLDGAEYLGVHAVDGYRLYDLGPYPAVVPGEGRVVGEIYELSTATHLQLLDEIEGCHHAPPLYQRVEVEVAGGPAWIYVYARPLATDARRIETGDWLNAT